MAEEAARQLAEQNISAGRIRRQVIQVGEARLAEREQAVAELKAIDLPSRRSGSSHREAPQVAVVMMDGGRYQRRDHFAAEALGLELGRQFVGDVPGEDDRAIGLVGEQPALLDHRDQGPRHAFADLQGPVDLADIVDDRLVEPYIVHQRRGA